MSIKAATTCSGESSNHIRPPPAPQQEVSSGTTASLGPHDRARVNREIGELSALLARLEQQIQARERALPLFKQIAEGLEAAHEQASSTAI